MSEIDIVDEYINCLEFPYNTPVNIDDIAVINIIIDKYQNKKYYIIKLLKSPIVFIEYIEYIEHISKNVNNIIIISNNNKYKINYKIWIKLRCLICKTLSDQKNINDFLPISIYIDSNNDKCINDNDAKCIEDLSLNLNNLII